MNQIFSLVFYLCIIWSLSDAIDCDVKEESNEERKIKKELFCKDYDNSLRPVQDHKTTVSVKVKMLIKSYEYNDYSSTLTINAWMINRWRDEFLTWDSRERGNIKEIDVSSSLIWRPDFSLYNADISYGIGSCQETDCLIESNGNITCVEPCSFTGHCKSSYAFWPFDKQNCSMIFGPWMNSQNEIDFIEDAINVTSDGAAEHAEWKLVYSSVVKKTVVLNSKDKKYTANFPNLSYTFILERHFSMHFKLLTVACFTFVALNLFSLFIRENMTERISLLIINVVLHFQMIHQMSWLTPHNGEETPKILLFYRNSLIINTLLMIESLIINSFITCNNKLGDRMKIIVTKIKANQFLDIFVQFKQNNKNLPQEEEEGAVLVEQPNINEMTKNNEAWRFLAILIDRCLFIILFIIYLISIFTLIPISKIIIKSV